MSAPTKPKLGELFEFRLFLDADRPMAKLECRDCGWTAVGRYREDVFPLADTHPCPVRDRHAVRANG